MPVVHAIPQTQESICKRRAGLTKVQINSLEVLFLCTYRHTHTWMLRTWEPNKEPNLIQTTGEVNTSYPAEANWLKRGELWEEMGHEAREGSFKCWLLPSTHWEPRKQIPNIHWRSAVLHDYRASQAEVISGLGAVIIPLSLGEIYSDHQKEMRQDCVTWLAISFRKESHDQDRKWIWQSPGQTQHTRLALGFLFILCKKPMSK